MTTNIYGITNICHKYLSNIKLVKTYKLKIDYNLFY